MQTIRVHLVLRPGKSCKLSTSVKFRDLECPQKNSQHRKTRNMCIDCWCGLGKSSNLDYPSSMQRPPLSIWNSKSSILHPLPQISFLQPQFSILNSSSFILRQKYGIFDWKYPQNSGNSNKMSASAACTACCIFQVCCPHCTIFLPISYKTPTKTKLGCVAYIPI